MYHAHCAPSWTCCQQIAAEARSILYIHCAISPMLTCAQRRLIAVDTRVFKRRNKMRPEDVMVGLNSMCMSRRKCLFSYLSSGRPQPRHQNQKRYNSFINDWGKGAKKIRTGRPFLSRIQRLIWSVIKFTMNHKNILFTTNHTHENSHVCI